MALEGRGQNKYWLTPKSFYRELDSRFKFDFDPCPFPKPDWDGLKVDWGIMNYVNPPFFKRDGGPIRLWIDKAYQELEKGKSSVFLLPLYDRALPSMVKGDKRFDFSPGRVKFRHIENGSSGKSPTFDSFLFMLLIDESLYPEKPIYADITKYED